MGPQILDDHFLYTKVGSVACTARLIRSALKIYIEELHETTPEIPTIIVGCEYPWPSTFLGPPMCQTGERIDWKYVGA